MQFCCTFVVLAAAAGSPVSAADPPKRKSPAKDYIQPGKRIEGPLSRYQTPLPKLPEARSTGNQPVELTVRKVDIKVDPDGDGPETPHTVHVRAYNGQLVGPVIRVKPGNTLRVRLRNAIEPTTPPPPDEAAGPADRDHNRPNRYDITNLHTHGLHVSPKRGADDVFLEVERGKTADYGYEVRADHLPGTHWYHPHRHGSTAFQLAGGMAGALIVEGGPGTLDAVPAVRAATEREQVLVFQQFQYVLDQDRVGRVYPRSLYGDPTLPVGRELEGDEQAYTLINGARFPRIKMKPGEVQRWRTIHAGLANSLKLVLVPVAGGDRVDLHEIAVDGLPLGTLRTGKVIELHPGYRSDFLVRAPKPGLYILGTTDLTAGESFRGIPRNAEDLAVVEVEDVPPLDMKLPAPDALKPFAIRPVTNNEIQGSPRRVLDFNITTDDDTGAIRSSTINAKPFMDPIPALNEPKPRVGTAEEWVLTSSEDSHPIHIHVNPFMVVLERDAVTKEPTKWEWRDTYVVNKGADKSVTIRMRYEHFDGRTVVHCHNLRHEDYGMMQVLDIQPEAGQGARPAAGRAAGLAAVPAPAPDWALAGIDRKPHRQADFAGRPTVLLFVRGYDCGHCREQLDAFAKRAQAFADAGVSLVAVAPGAADTAADALRDDPPARPYPFPLLADADQAVFRAYGCHSDGALHGTFVVDGGGVVRWQRVGNDPFMDVEAVLKECRAIDGARR